MHGYELRAWLATAAPVATSASRRAAVAHGRGAGPARSTASSASQEHAVRRGGGVVATTKHEL
jgi:hypothetical protein